MSILQKPIHVPGVSKRLFGAGLILPLGLWHIWPHPDQHPGLSVGAVGGSWQARGCSKALAFVSSGGQ